MPGKLRRILLSAFFLGCGQIWANPVWISLFNNSQVQNVALTAYAGPVTAFGDGKLFTIAKGQAVNVVLNGEKLVAANTDSLIGVFEQLTIIADTGSIIRIRPVLPLTASRNYEATVSLSADIGRIRMINQLEERSYLAGVIEAETGTGRSEEFYKAVAVICRTYLYGHANRHESEGFHLCDETHCQSYRGKSRNDARIPAAVEATGDTVIVDNDSLPILAAYHANCGGETESAKNAWQIDMPYLVPVSDPYCSAFSNARWKKTISIDEWIQYLIKNGFKINPAVVTDFSFRPDRRTPNYKVNTFVLPFKQIRNDWNLRSAFFDVSLEDGKIQLDGHGYGHGVGLCQEGAMEMGKRGYKYEEIIRFYYRNVKLVPASKIQAQIPNL
ncbi:MAG: SpoIID/LytB domain-containing protein [Bacteroidales bacterium]|jgi:stage II sporulation protein D|nr:SpoIID/LytB domain-containing protein [Bacteroidales bacterium]